uniref:Uncharacterized protein n=1 Tax=Setaria italica TaxID=4555 RepID=K3ZG08_SETIT
MKDCHAITGFELSIKRTGKIRCLKLVEAKYAVCSLTRWTAQFWKGCLFPSLSIMSIVGVVRWSHGL